MYQHHMPQSHHLQSLAQTRNNHKSRVKHNAYAWQTMGHIRQFVEIQYIHSKDEARARFINKTNNTKINFNRRNSGSIQH
jgi:hypothetical protein